MSWARCPVRVLFGTKDTMIPAEMGRVYREKPPNCYYSLVYDAGHARFRVNAVVAPTPRTCVSRAKAKASMPWARR